jgi:hypothetical protein
MGAKVTILNTPIIISLKFYPEKFNNKNTAA